MAIRLRRNRGFESSAPEVRAIRSRRDVERYLRFLAVPYAADPNWIPADLEPLRDLLRGRGALSSGTVSQAFLAEVDGEPVAAMTAAMHKGAAEAEPRDTATLGWFEALSGQDAAVAALFAAAEAWARAQGAGAVWGPVNGHPAYGFGCLDEGHEEPPPLGSHHDGKEAAGRWWQQGYKRGSTFFSYRVDLTSEGTLSAIRAASAAPIAGEIAIRSADLSRWRREVAMVIAVTNADSRGTWGEASLPEDEARQLLEPLARMADPPLTRVAEVAGEAVGFVLALPDANEVAASERRAASKVHAALARWLLRRRIHRGVVLGLAVRPEWRRRGLATRLLAESLEAMIERRMTSAELARFREDDAASRRLAERFGGRESRRYLTFRKRLA